MSMELVKFCMESLVWFLGMDSYGFLWILGFLILFLELGFEVLKSVSTCWEYRIHPWSMNSYL